LVLIVGASVRAQGTEFQLDEKGQWVAKPGKPLDADEALMLRARELLADNKPGQAESILTPWIDAHKSSENKNLPEAYLLRGDAITADGNEYEALYDYEAVIKGYPATEQYRRAIERELEIGIKYVYGLKRKWFGLRWSDATDIGEELLVRTQERLPGDELAERAGIELADYYYRTRELRLASEAYEIFLANFPKSRYADRARQRRIYANIARFKGPNYDASGLTDAKVLIEEYAATDPIGAQRAGLSDAMIARLDESAAAQILEKAKWYMTRGDPVGARSSLRRLIAKHPQTVAARTGLQMVESRGWSLDARPVPRPETKPTMPPGPAAGPDASSKTEANP